MKLSKHTVIVFSTLSFSSISACIPDANTSQKDASLAGSGGTSVSPGGSGGSGGSGGNSGNGGTVSTGGSGGSAGSSSTTTATGGSKSTSAASGGSTTPAVDSGSSSATCTTGCAPLPLVVDGKDHFVPSGYMGDWNGIKEVSSATDAAACSPARSSATAVGDCHHWTWNYSNGTCATASDPQAVCGQWACVAWLKPYNLFTDPTKPGPSGGLPVAAGATKVRFWAWAPKPTGIRFSVGSGSDGVSGSVSASLTTTPAKFEIDISMSSYNVVNNGFQWCANDNGATSTEFYVDDIQWM
jgi:hypothetical protein